MHHRWAVGAVEHDQFEQVSCPVGTQDQLARRVIVDLVHKERTTQGVLDVFVRDSMAERRSENLHNRNRTTEPPSSLA